LYFIIPERRDGKLNIAPMAAVQEFCLGQGIRQISAIVETWWLPRFQEAGFKVTPLGLPALVESAWTIAGLIDIDDATLHALLDRMGRRSTIQHREPHQHAIARARSRAARDESFRCADP
jgi:acyl-homoserine lactone synthase